MPEDIKEKNNGADIEDLCRLVQASMDQNSEILEISRSIKRYIRWQSVWSTVRLLLILAPIILGFIYLPPLIREYLESYKALLQ